MTAQGDGYVSAAFDLAGVDRLDPGEGAEAVVQIPSLTLKDWAPQVGDRFEVYEAPGRPVAKCTVLAQEVAVAGRSAELIDADA